MSPSPHTQSPGHVAPFRFGSGMSTSLKVFASCLVAHHSPDTEAKLSMSVIKNSQMRIVNDRFFFYYFFILNVYTLLTMVYFAFYYAVFLVYLIFFLSVLFVSSLSSFLSFWSFIFDSKIFIILKNESLFQGAALRGKVWEYSIEKMHEKERNIVWDWLCNYLNYAFLWLISVCEGINLWWYFFI